MMTDSHRYLAIISTMAERPLFISTADCCHLLFPLFFAVPFRRGWNLL